MLTKITDPNGEVIIENEYQLDGPTDLRRRGRVVRQKYGDEAYNYVVTALDGSRTSTGYDYDYYVWVNDRRGAVTRFKYAKRVGNDDSGPTRDRQLLEKTEFLGFVNHPNGGNGADIRVWGIPQPGTAISWRYLDENGNEASFNGQNLHDRVTTTFTPDANWNVANTTFPNGNSIGQTYRNHDYPLPPSGVADPRFSKTVTSRTTNSDDNSISITEYWRYDFDFGGGGCGCGSSGFATAYKDGEENVTRNTYDANGNMLAVYRGLPPSYFTDTLGSNVADDAASIDEYTYNQWGQVITHTHPEQVVLDTQGNPTTHRRVDSFEYYNNPSDPANYGRLHKQHIDVNGYDLTTTYEYDLIGNIIKETSPDGDVTEYLYNQASQLVRMQRYDDSSNLYAEEMYFYDANGNMVVEEELNLDMSGSPVAEGSENSETTWFTTIHLYDKLGYRTETSREKNPIPGIFNSYTANSKQASSQSASMDFITQRWTYDPNRNLTRFEDGEAVSGGQASNVVKHEYDARDLRIQTVAGAGGSSPLKTEYEYDEDGLLTIKTVDPDSLTQSQHTTYIYDGINRVTSVLDPMGNEFIYEYDNNHNIKRVTACGPIGDDHDPSQSDASNTLAEISRIYDRLDRYTSQSIEVFDNSSPASCDQLPSASQQQTTTIIYNADSSIHERSVPSGDGQLDNVTEYFYDTASRVEFVVDGAGNITENEYDSDSNLTGITRTDFSSETPTTTQVFHVDYAYDPLNRQISMIDGVGNDTLYAYDSRSNMVEMTDAREHVTSYIYDALSRRTQVDRELSISKSSAYDDSNRLISETDDNGNTTQYEYDGLNRVVKITMPDGAYYSIAYDDNGNPATYTDARGVVITQTFDLDNRLVSRAINDSAVSGGIPGAAAEAFTYDGLGRLRTADNDFARVTREYDSRSNLTREVQNINAVSSFSGAYDRAVEYGYDGASNNTRLTYPGGRVIHRTYDELNRLVGIFNDAQFADPVTEFEYVGNRIAGRVHGNGTRTAYTYNGYTGAQVETGDKGFGRVNKITTTNTSTSAILDAFTFTWDAAQNRTTYKDTGSGTPDRRHRAFGYDPLNRLVSTDVDFPDPNTSHTAPTSSGVTTYTLDGVHNRTAVGGFEELGAPIGTYAQSGDQALNNQYTQTPRPAGGAWDYTYDANGNLLIKAQHSVADYNSDYTHDFFDMAQFLTDYGNADPDADINGDGEVNYADVSAFSAAYGPLDGTSLEHWHYGYDYRNQLVSISHRQGSTTLAETFNTYDALARRVEESIDLNADSTPDAAKQLVYGGVSSWEVLEQIDLLNDETSFTHVFGIGIDDEVSYRIEDLQTPEDYWSHRDDLNTLTSITDGSGAVVERYEYGDYGDARVFDASGTELAVSVYLPQHLYTGRMVIGGTGLLDYRFRVLETGTGRFGQRDPVGYLDAMNPYTYVASNPLRYQDPYGLMLNDEGLGGGIGQHPSMGMSIDTFVNGHRASGAPIYINSGTKSGPAGVTAFDVIGEIDRARRAIERFNEMGRTEKALTACENAGGEPVVVYNDQRMSEVECYPSACSALNPIRGLIEDSRPGYNRYEDRESSNGFWDGLADTMRYVAAKNGERNGMSDLDERDWGQFKYLNDVIKDLLKKCAEEQDCTPSMSGIVRPS